MKVSIIMPAYNSEKHISEAIDSVINQSLSDWEMIIIDDGSTDCTGKITDEYSQKDFRIKVFHQSNKGVSAARNYALERITGGYVTFLDSDDVYHPERLKMMVDELSKDPDCDAVFANYQEFRGNTRIEEDSVINSAEVLQEKIVEKIIQDSRLQFMWNVMMKSEIAKNVRFADLKFAEDYCFIRDCSCYMKKITVIDPVLYYYRRDNENAIRIRNSILYVRFVNCMEEVIFRKGIVYVGSSMCLSFEKKLFGLLKHRPYFPNVFWVW